MAKLWAGRFSKEVDETVNAFNSSIAFDGRMYRHDILGSIAHATMLGDCGIITKADSETLIKGLQEILSDLEDGRLSLDPTAEDIHMFVEAELTKRLGDVGKRLHTARSRNDQVALDVRLYLRDEIKEIQTLVYDLVDALCAMAKEHLDTIMPGYTHLQRAQPITLAHHLMAYANMLSRDYDRLTDTAKRMNYCPLGSGALAGTTYPINRQQTASLLGFTAPVANSLDGVSDRDSCVELAAALSLLMTHLSRFSEEIILWCSSEYSFIELDDAYSTGSSIMPQKKNPDVAELVRGKTGRVYGNMTALFTMMKALPLAYNKDMQEDKEAIFDSIDNVKLCLEVFGAMFDTITVKKEKMRAAASGGFINATDCADYLVRRGLPFRDAYKITGKLVAYCIETSKTFETLTLDEYLSFSDKFEKGVYDAVNLENCVADRKVYGGPAPASVDNQLSLLYSFIKNNKN